MKKPFAFALLAAAYIAGLVGMMNLLIPLMPQKSLLIPMVLLSLFVLSASIMGFLFLSEPLQLYLDGHKKEAGEFFLQIVGFFACFAALFLLLLFLI